MSVDQTPTVRPKPVTQRDGSTLQNSNCRMASIAAGIAYHSPGTTSTGAKMRSYTDDQSGGTDAGDARQSWARGYDEALAIRDGNGWAEVLLDLRAGRVVHIDVWHASVSGSGICRSGSGAYGHTMAILPDCKDNAWLVNDPWCSPPKWGRVSESSLKAGAEEWGRRVFGEARSEPDYPTGGPVDPRDELVLRIVARVVKRLMSRFHAGGDMDPAPAPVDTGGAQPVLFTVTRAQALEGGEVVGDTFNPEGTVIGKATTTKAIGIIPAEGGEYYPLEVGTVRNVITEGAMSSGPYEGQRAFYVEIPDGKGRAGYLLASACTYTPNPAPQPPQPPAEDCAQELAARDEEWETALREGNPWPTA